MAIIPSIGEITEITTSMAESRIRQIAVFYGYENKSQKTPSRSPAGSPRPHPHTHESPKLCHERCCFLRHAKNRKTVAVAPRRFRTEACGKRSSVCRQRRRQAKGGAGPF